MRTIGIEWRHLDVDGRTCTRCGDTGQQLQHAVEQLNRECAGSNLRFVLRETRLASEAIDESNAVLIDGHYLETLLPQAASGASSCSSCATLLCAPQTDCRTIEYKGRSYDTITAELVREAVCAWIPCCSAQGTQACCG